MKGRRLKEKTCKQRGVRGVEVREGAVNKRAAKKHTEREGEREREGGREKEKKMSVWVSCWC